MKKPVVMGVAIVSILICLISMGVMGIQIMQNYYDFEPAAYTAFISLMVYFLCMVYVKCGARCPHCGKRRVSEGKYCPYCGKEI